MNKKQSTSKGFLILSFSGILNKILAIIYLPIQTLIVGYEGNGIIAQGYIIYIFIFSLSNSGIPVAVSKLVSEQSALKNYNNSKKVLKVAISLLFVMGFVLCILMVFLAKTASEALRQPEATLMIKCLGPALIFTSIAGAFRGYFQGQSNMIPTATSQVIEQLINSISTVSLVALFYYNSGHSLKMAAAGSGIATGLGAIGAVIYLVYTYFKNEKKFYMKFDSKNVDNSKMTYKFILKHIISYLLPAMVGVAALNASSLIDLGLIRRMVDGGIDLKDAKVFYGIYTTQYQKILNIPLSLTSVLPSALIPALSSSMAVKDLTTFKHKLVSGFKVAFVIIVPSAFGLSILAQPILKLIFYTKNRGSDLLLIGSWVILLIAVNSIQTAILISIGKPRIAPTNLLIGMIIKIFITYIFVQVPFLNVKAAIIGTSVGYLIALVLNQKAIKKCTKVNVGYFNILYKPILASLIMSIISFFAYNLLYNILGNLFDFTIVISDIALVISIILGAFSYAVILIKLKAVDSEDISKLPFGNKINKYISKFITEKK